jgi:hypothetical protein
MFNFLASAYSNLQFINELFLALQRAVEHNQPDNFRSSVAKLENKVLEGYAAQDDELLACIVHHELELVKVLSKSNQLAYIALLLKSDGKNTRYITTLAQSSEEELLGHLLVDQIDFTKYAQALEKDKKHILPLKRKILDTIEQKSPLKSNTPLDGLPNLLQMAQYDSEQIEYLLKKTQARLAICFYNNNAAGYATLLQQIGSVETKKQDINFPHFDKTSFLSFFNFLSSHLELKLYWLLLHATPHYRDAKERYGVEYAALLAFRKEVETQLQIQNAQIYADDFDASIQALRALFTHTTLNKTALASTLMTMYTIIADDLMHNDAEQLAHHLNQWIELVLQTNNPVFNALFLELFNVDIQAVKACKGLLSWSVFFILDEAIKNSGMGYEEYLDFKRRFARANPTPLPKAQEVLQDLKSSLENGLAINPTPFEILVQNFYLQQQTTEFSAFLNQFLSLLMQAESQTRNNTLVVFFNLLSTESQSLFKALAEKDSFGVLELITSFSFKKIQYTSMVPASIEAFKKEVQAHLGLKKITPTTEEVLQKPPVKLDVQKIKSDIAQSNYAELAKSQILRKYWYRYAIHQKDTALYCALLKHDLFLLRDAWRNNQQSEIIVFMNLHYPTVTLLNLMLPQLSDEELLLCMLTHQITSYHGFLGISIKEDLWPFRAKVLQELSEEYKKPLSQPFATLFNRFEQALKQPNEKEMSIIRHKLDFFFLEALCLLQNNKQTAVQTAAQIILLIQRLSQAYQHPQSAPYVLTILEKITALDLEVVQALLLSNELELIVWHAIHFFIQTRYRGLDAHTPERLRIENDLILESALLLKRPQEQTRDLIALALGTQTVNHPELLDSAHSLLSKMRHAVEQDNFLELRTLRAHLEALLIDSFNKRDAQKVTFLTEAFTKLCLALYQENNLNALHSLAHNDHFEWLECMGQSINLDQLPKYCCIMLCEFYRESFSLPSMPKEDKAQFFKAIYNSWDMRAVSNPRHQAQGFCLTQNKEAFAQFIRLTAKRLQEAYQNNQLSSVMKEFDLSHEELDALLTYLCTNHLKAVEEWFIEYCLKHYCQNLLNPCDKEELLQALRAELGIAIHDLMAMGKSNEAANKGQFQDVFAAVRALTQNGVNVLKAPTVLNLVARIPNIHLLLTQNRPGANDNILYQRAHEMMSAVWHTHIAVHVFSLLKVNYFLNDFEVKGSGSYNGFMLTYLLSTHQKPEVQSKLNAFLERVHTNYFKQLPASSSPAKLLQQLNEALIESTKPNSASDKTKTLIRAIPVGYDSHAVACVFKEDEVMFSDRGVAKNDFSGMQFYKIGNMLELASCIEALEQCTENKLTRYEYKRLQTKLNLRPIDSIALDHQYIGNCGFSSQAEPLYLAVLYYTFLDWGLQTGRCMDDARELAAFIAAEMTSITRREMELSSINELIAFFKNPQCTVNLPVDLFAHLHQAALFQSKNQKAASAIEQTRWVDCQARGQTFKELKQHFRNQIEEFLSNQSRKSIDQRIVDSEAEYAANFFLSKDVQHHDLLEHMKLRLALHCPHAAADNPWVFFSKGSLLQRLQAMTPKALIDAAHREEVQMK